VGDGNISGGGIVEMSGMERENVEDATIAVIAASPEGEAGAVEAPAPKRRGRPPGGGRGAAGGAKVAGRGEAAEVVEAALAGTKDAGAVRDGAVDVTTGTAGGKPAKGGPVGATEMQAAPPRRGSKAAALAARQAEEEALELQQLTAPHIPNCSPEWQQFYLKVRREAVRER
jgi:hypothetical protein